MHARSIGNTGDGRGAGHAPAPRPTVARLAVLLAAAAILLTACGPLATIGATPAPAASGTAASPLVGTWVTEIGPEVLTKAGITDPGLIDENTGRFSWTFNADGTWDQLQESRTGARIANPVWKGTWTTDGDELAQTTTFPTEYAGTLRFRYAFEGGALRLQVIEPPDPITPLVTDTYPWTRVP